MQTWNRRIRGSALGWGLSLVCVMAGCAGDSMPRVRVGALPFPGPFTLYSTVDPAKLGPHYYDDWAFRARRPQEGPSGIVYTTKGGFLDLSHVRESADWVRYIAGRAAPMLMSDDPATASVATWEHQDSVFALRITPPAWFVELPRDERAAQVGPVSAEIAAAAAYLLMNWHEVATWEGWTTVPLVSERRSAFTWDDSMSHLVGIEVGRKAVRAGWTKGPEYDRAVTEGLALELRRLDARSPQETDDAAEDVRGLWWIPSPSGGEAVRRQTHVGLDGLAVVPWTVRASPAPYHTHAPMALKFMGNDLSSCWALRIAPPSWLLDRTRAPHDSTRTFDARAEMPALIENVGRQMRAEFGDRATTHEFPRVEPAK